MERRGSIGRRAAETLGRRAADGGSSGLVLLGSNGGPKGSQPSRPLYQAVLYRCSPIFTDFFGLSCENRVLSDDLVVGVLPEHYLVLVRCRFSWFSSL